MTRDLVLLGDLLAATKDAHSPRALLQSIATVLGSRWPLTRIELRSAGLVAERAGTEWRLIETREVSATAPERASSPVELASSSRSPVEPAISPSSPVELAISPSVELAAEFSRALGHVITSVLRHCEVVHRVAQLSRRAHTENRDLRADLQRLGAGPEIIARSTAMRGAMSRATLVARHTSNVLLLGESGTGKEVVAREIHRLSARSHRALVQVNCGAIPAGLFESELFGHERGAFTGADRKHVGAFERAHRGTLFLDEVGELSAAAQVKLLRVLQERQIHRVGGEAPIDVDVRLIAATNRSLAGMVEEGTFREDLYYRLDVFAIQLPPLRERKGDLGPLAAELVSQLAIKLGVAKPAIPRGVLARLEAHDWPGNVRELMNVLETALILGDGKALELPEELARRSRRKPPGSDFKAAVRMTIENALQTTRGKIYGKGGAAELLGLKPGTLQSKMVKLGIQRAAFT
ncbi:MAG: sigma 54-interacting transcriptional regulator [Deltaproteobacteria bacterium]|nr:sigma 54-interacting transcriptional regulator [Deltaproteobacteria bacterium]